MDNHFKKSMQDENFANLNLNNKYNIYQDKKPNINLNVNQIPSTTFGVPNPNLNRDIVHLNVNENIQKIDNKTAEFNVNHENVNVTVPNEEVNKTISTVISIC